MYADIEAILEKMDPIESKNTQRINRHIPCAIGNMIVSRIPGNQFHGKYVEYSGKECMSEFINYLEHVARQVHCWSRGFETRVRAQRTAQEKRKYNSENQCYLCTKSFDTPGDKGSQKHFDHDHLTGLYRGAACADCNRKMRLDRNTVPIYFHNYRGYDNHHIVHAFNGRKGWTMEPIAQNLEKFMTMAAGVQVGVTDKGNPININMCFRDSYQVLAEGLATLVENVGEESLHET